MWIQLLLFQQQKFFIEQKNNKFSLEFLKERKNIINQFMLLETIHRIIPTIYLNKSKKVNSLKMQKIFIIMIANSQKNIHVMIIVKIEKWNFVNENI